MVQFRAMKSPGHSGFRAISSRLARPPTVLGALTTLKREGATKFFTMCRSTLRTTGGGTSGLWMGDAVTRRAVGTRAVVRDLPVCVRATVSRDNAGGVAVLAA